LGIFARLEHPCSDRFTPCGAVQKNPSGRIISSLDWEKLDEMGQRGVFLTASRGREIVTAESLIAKCS
jgi:hypothetical protein